MITVIGGLVVPIAFPMLLLFWMWLGQFSSRSTWAFALAGSTLALILLFWISRWDVVGLHWRFTVPLVWIGCVASYVQVSELGWRSVHDEGWLPWLGTYLAPNVVLAAFCLWMFAGMQPPADAVQVQSPLLDGDFYVLHGGGSALLNYHRAFDETHAYALDITAVREEGRRADGILPSDREAYAIYGEPVHSPINGTVVATKRSLPDQPPSTRDRTIPLGNFVLIQQESLFIALAHLQEESLQVEPGDIVSAGDVLGRVGNSGSSSEPHLHVHAIRYGGPHPASLETIHEEGTAQPLLIDGEYLVRNDRF